MGSEAIRLLCPNLKCRTLLSVPPLARGKAVRCRACGTRIKVPAEPRRKPADTMANAAPANGSPADDAQTAGTVE
jgi:hypothetical protein